MRALALIAALVALPAFASEDIADQYPGSPLYSKPVEFIPGVWSAIGATAPPTYENTGHNNNLSFIVTGDGVIVINGGAAYVLARALHDEIRKVTDQPVKLVINENGQGHAMLGNSYWAEQGVPILAHVEAAEEFENDAYNILEGMKRYNRDKAEGTVAQGPTITFEDEYIIDMGAMHIEVLHLGPAHSAWRYLCLAARTETGDRGRHGVSRTHAADLCRYLHLVLDRDLGDEVRTARRALRDPRSRPPDQHGSGPPLHPRLPGRPARQRSAHIWTMAAIWQMRIMSTKAPGRIWTRLKSWPPRTRAACIEEMEFE